MTGLKFRKIKNETMTKELFASLSEIIKQDLMQEEISFPPLHEIYNLMIENTKIRSSIQFCCELYKVVLGFVISSRSQINPDTLIIPVICVKNKFRNKGIAVEILKETESQAKKNKIKKIRMSYSPSGKAFCEKNGYKLRLEICVPEDISDEELSFLQSLPIEYIRSTLHDGKDYLLFEINKDNQTLLTNITKAIKNSTAKYIFEKEI